MAKVVLAYTGNLGTSLCIRWLEMKRGYEVTTFSANVGQDEFLEPIGERAIRNGAESAHIFDLRERFLREYCFPALQAGAVYQGGYHLFTALSRPLIVEEMVRIALDEGADAVAHGCTKGGNDLVRFQAAVRSLAPHIEVVAPLMEWGMSSPEDQRAAAERYDLPAREEASRLQTVEANIWGSSVPAAAAGAPWQDVPEEAYRRTRSPAEAPDEPAEVVVGFREGTPVALDGEDRPPVELVDHLNELAGEHGVGRHDIMEDAIDGTKLRQIYEAPAATVLHAAHRALGSLVHDREMRELLHDAGRTYASLVYRGKWLSERREALADLVRRAQVRMTGDVRVRLHGGRLTVRGIRSPHSLYDRDRAARHGTEGSLGLEMARRALGRSGAEMEIESRPDAYLD